MDLPARSVKDARMVTFYSPAMIPIREVGYALSDFLWHKGFLNEVIGLKIGNLKVAQRDGMVFVLFWANTS